MGEEKVYKRDSSNIQSIFYFSIGYPMSANSYDFFQNYRNILEGLKSNFEISFMLYMSNKYMITEKIRVGLALEYFTALLNDSFIQDVLTTDEEFYRTITEDITVTSFPSFITIEYVPNNLQFSTYLGLGFGIDITKIKWSEKLESSNIIDRRKGGLHFDDLIICPAFRLYSGIELGFDKYTENMIIRSFHFELNVTYSMRNIDLFNNISHQFEEPKSENISKSYTIIPFYFGLNIGVSFNLYRREFD